MKIYRFFNSISAELVKSLKDLDRLNEKKEKWCERRGLNPRQPGPQPGALPTELHSPHLIFPFIK